MLPFCVDLYTLQTICKHQVRVITENVITEMHLRDGDCRSIGIYSKICQNFEQQKNIISFNIYLTL